MHREYRRCGPALVVSLLLALGGAAAAPRTPDAAAIQVSHDGFSAHAEPSLAVNPRDPGQLLGAAMLIQGHHVVVGTFSSADGGLTWRDHGPLAMPPGTTYSGDVTVAFDGHGHGFVACLVQAAAGDGVYVWRTDDGGRRFQRPVAAMRGPFADHPGLAVDEAPGPAGGTLYVTWRTRGGLAVSRSTDVGRHFTAPQTIVAGAEIYVPVVAAGRGGVVAIAYEVLTQGDPQAGTPLRVAPGHVAVVSSADRGRHFGRPVVVDTMSDTLTPAPGVRLPTGPSVAMDPRDGAVYLAYVDERAGHPVLQVARSGAGVGYTWTAPLAIPAEPGSGAGVPARGSPFQPHVVVDGAGGVALTFFALTRGRVAVILTQVAARGTRVGARRDVTGRSFDPTLGVLSAGKGQDGSYWWIGDYQGLAVGGGLLHPFWNDTRTGRLEIFTATVPITLPANGAPPSGPWGTRTRAWGWLGASTS